ncbi:MAG: hypothetical protein KJO07_08080 [Deltaproteobacteria bacterium]|nr:hypothetical protein [Deltaproteobacteria bacterium]
MKHIIKSLSIVSALALTAAGSAEAKQDRHAPNKRAKQKRGKKLGHAPTKPGKKLGHATPKPRKPAIANRRSKRPSYRQPVVRKPVQRPAYRQPVAKQPVKRRDFRKQRTPPPRITRPAPRPSWSFKIYIPPMTYTTAYNTSSRLTVRWNRLLSKTDFNRNGSISKAEVRRANRVSIIRTGKRAFNVATLFANYDHDHDGVITRREFSRKRVRGNLTAGYWM